MAENYINENFKTLPVKMGEKDSLQDGLRLYNEGQYDSALNNSSQWCKETQEIIY